MWPRRWWTAFPVEEPHLAAHRIAESSRILCAAPAYRARRGVPAAPADLSRHDCLVLARPLRGLRLVRVDGPNGSEKVKGTGRLSSNNSEIVRGWAIDGHGILLTSD
ncbi:MAG: hypothetical protein JSR42_13655 [Proteobacteria bacterium]|nr:hypothetical protein [Pseudomonadota bacterium]MBS0554092.1 hypothetical protein [Pseudomonadota bacterium]